MGKQYIDKFKLADIIRSAGGKNDLKGTPRKPRPGSVQQDVWQAALDIMHHLTVDLDQEVQDLKRTKLSIKNKEVTAELDGKGYLFIKTCEKQEVNQWFELGALYRELLDTIEKTQYNQYYSFKTNKRAKSDFASIAKEAMLIERFMGLHDKVITRTTIEKFIEDLQQAIQEKKIRKTSPVAGEIMEMQKALIQIYNRMDRSLHVVLKPATMKRLKDIIVKFDNAVDRAERPNRDKPKIKTIPLAGIPEPVSAPSGKLMNSTDFVKLNFQRIGFTGKWFDLMGDPAPGFTAMVFGKPKFGKSFLCIEWAGYLARNHGKVLYAAKEEGLDATLQEKLKDKDVQHPNLTVSDYIPADLSAYDFIFLDSVNKFGLSPEDLEKMKKANPGKSFIYIFQSTKEGKFRGTNEYQHDVDVVIEVPEKGKAVQFGRFNQGGEMNIFDKEPQGEKEPALDGIRKSRAQLKNSTRVAHYHRYYYVIDLDERGSFRAHVEDQTGKSVYEFVAGNELGEDESDLFQDGWMKGKNDIRGLEKYLRQQGVIGRYDQISAEQNSDLGTVKSKARPRGSANLNIETELGMPLEELAIELLSPKEARTNIVSLIYEDTPRVEEAVKIMAEEFIKKEKAKVSVGELSFTENDSDNISHGAAYFKVMLEGSILELKKVAGVDKMFFYDWENHH